MAALRAAALPAGVAQASRRPRLPVLALALIAALGVLYVKVVSVTLPPHQDFDAYLAAGRAVWQKQSIYASFLSASSVDAARRPLAFIYPPVFALMTAPLARLPSELAWWVWLGLMEAALLLAMVLVLRSMRASRAVVLTTVAVTLAFNPLWWDTISGQTNLLILLLVTAGIVGSINGSSRAVALIGVAAALKLTPLLLLAWLLVERRLRAAFWLCAGFAVMTAAGALALPHDSWVYLRQVVPSLSQGTINPASQSLTGVLGRFFGDATAARGLFPLSFEPVLPLAVAACALAYWVLCRGGQPDPFRRAAMFLPLLPLASPITWEHHLIILLPLVWLCLHDVAAGGWPAKDVLILAAIGACLCLIPAWQLGSLIDDARLRALHDANPVVWLIANSPFLGTVILFLTAPRLLRA